MIRAFFSCNRGTANLGRFMFLSGLEAEEVNMKILHFVEHNAPTYWIAKSRNGQRIYCNVV